MILAPFYSLFAVGNISAFPPLMCIALFIVYQHRDNINRLMDGTESKINLHKKTHHKKTPNEPLIKESKPEKIVKTTTKTAPKKKPNKEKPIKKQKVTPKKAAPKKAAPKKPI